MARIVSITGERRTPLRDGWRAVLVQQGRVPVDEDFHEASVPGTIAEVLIQLSRWSWDDPVPLDEREVWYRCDFETGGAQCIEFGGLATIAEIFLDGVQIASSRNMFVPLKCNVNLRGKHRLEIRFGALTPYLENKAPRARWRPRMIQPAGLRNVRTTALGRMPGFAPPAPPIGPWRDVELVAHGSLRVVSADVKARLEGTTGILDVRLETEGAKLGSATLTCAGKTTRLAQTGPNAFEATLRIPDVRNGGRIRMARRTYTR